jgi:hypothetical protein
MWQRRGNNRSIMRVLFCSSHNITWVIKSRTGHVESAGVTMVYNTSNPWTRRGSHMSEITNAYKFMIVRPRGNGPLARPKHKWGDNINMGFLCSLHCITWVIISRRLHWTGHVSHTVEITNSYKIIVGPWGKRLLARPRHSWEDNIKIYISGILAKGAHFSPLSSLK